MPDPGMPNCSPAWAPDYSHLEKLLFALPTHKSGLTAASLRFLPWCQMMGLAYTRFAVPPI